MSASSHDVYWLDRPILKSRNRFNPAIRWFIDQIPVRARHVILAAAQGKLTARHPIAPVATLWEFIGLPTKTLLYQRNYRNKTHAALCRAFREQGFIGQLFSDDEGHLPHI